MGGGKETPRQKLIGLMYLVLMALLAMNVSKSILSAFITIDEKFEHASELTDATNEGLMAKINAKLVGLKSTKAAKEDIKKVEGVLKKGEEIRELARRTSNFFVSEAADMIVTSDPLMPTPFYDDNDGYLKLKKMDTLSKKDDYDTAPHIYLKDGTHEPSERGIAVENKIFSYRDSLVMLAAEFEEEKGGKKIKYYVDPSKVVRPHTKQDTVEYNKSVTEALKTAKADDRPRLKRIFDILTIPETVENNHGEKPHPWIAYQFDHTVIVAAAAIFNSLKTDTKMAEAIALEIISGRANGPTFNFNKIEPLAFSSTSYINQGDSLGLKVMIAAYDSTEKMKLKYWIDDTTKSGEPLTFEGKAGDELKLSGSVGEHILTGVIAVKEKGVEKWKPWKFKYSVGAPNGAIANSEMNVLYRGWDNKIEVSASGYDPSTVSVSCSGCKTSKKGDGYIARVSGSAKKATLTITAKDKDGNSVKIASKEFRIFNLPVPKPYFADQTFDRATIRKSTATGASMIKAKIGDSPLDVTYKVTSFKMSGVKNGKGFDMKSKGPRLTGQMKAYVKKIGKGSKLIFTDIKAVGPSGKEKNIGSLVFKVI